MGKEKLRKIIYSKIDELPTLPAVVPKLMNLMENCKSDASDITEAVAHDPALTSKILKVANSAYYGFPQKISDLERAVALLGFNIVRSLALSIGIIRSLPVDKTSPYFTWDGLWMHSTGVATLMREVGKRFGSKGENEYYFVIGLLHDIGKVVQNLFFQESFQQVLEEVQTLDNTVLYEAERRIMGFEHGEVGAMLLERWRFPEPISIPIALHHVKGIPNGPNGLDVAMLRIADILCQERGLGEVGLPNNPPRVGKADLERVGMGQQDLKGMRAYLECAEEEISAFFNAMK